VGAIWYSRFETAAYAQRTNNKIRALNKDYRAAYATKPPSPDCCKTFAEYWEKYLEWKKGQPQALRNWEDFLDRWDAFLNKYFDDDLTVKVSWLTPAVGVLSPVSAVPYDAWKSTEIYNETVKYDIEADGFANRYKEAFGKPPPTVPATVTAKDIETKKKEIEGESSFKLPSVDLNLAGLLTTAAVIFVAGAFLISRTK
jgi:hypothetical protein